ncbi:SDR family oxidoreductase [Rhizobium helianthi]|uniref:SDR family oxidoreductase n=1 Tax=Rhizobium helianthi TaxID=1132695 RepID=A0ABW4M2D0_9HYPH
MRVMIFGAGYSGQAIGAELLSAGASVAGTTRSEDKAAHLRQSAIRPFLFDGHAISDGLRTELRETTHLIQSIAPGSAGDPVLMLSGDRLLDLMPKLEWCAYLSTVGVYGDHEGGWVDEDTLCKPVSARSRERVAAEDGWITAAMRDALPLAILRLSGIYGPGRNGFINLAEGNARRLVKPGQVFNRIRVEDIARATRFLADRKADGIFNVTDHEPAPPQDVVTEAARIMGVAPPPEQAFETAELSPMARSFYGENKRVSNEKIRNLGFSFRYPDYRVSLRQLWDDGRWRA